MAKLTDLPDEILTLIFQHFKLSGQASPYLRSYFEKEYADVARRANLAAVAQVCKRLLGISKPLLYDNRYLVLSMTILEPHLVERRLALLSKCRQLRHLICDLFEDRADSFLVCLANSAVAYDLRGLSLRFRYKNTAAIDLRSLSCLPNLQGLQLDFNNVNSTVVPPAINLRLIELHIHHTRTLEQTVAALSLGSSKFLEILELEFCSVKNTEAETSIWRRALGHKRFQKVRSLFITLSLEEDTPGTTLAEISSYLPALQIFRLCYDVPPVNFKHCLRTMPAHVTDLSISVHIQDLKPLLLFLVRDTHSRSKLRAVHVTLDCVHVWWDQARDDYIVHLPDFITLSREARKVTSSNGIELTPKNLTEILERLEGTDEEHDIEEGQE